MSSRVSKIQIEVDLDEAGRVEWGSRKTVWLKFEIDDKILNQLVASGVVPSRKLGTSKQAKRIYDLDALRAWLRDEGQVANA